MSDQSKKSAARVATVKCAKNDDVTAESTRLVKDPKALWKRYVEWQYQHKGLGIYLDVSRIGFTDEFVEKMKPRFEKAFKHMVELERGAIANPDEGRMVGHYWLRNSKLAPNESLKKQIDLTLDDLCRFADDVITGKVNFSFSSSYFSLNIFCKL